MSFSDLLTTANAAGANPRLIFPTIVLAYLIYRYIQRRRDFQAETAFGEKHGCMPMETKLPYKWPFALDILKRQYDALPSQRLLAFQTQYFNRIGPNMKLGLFGQEGYMTTDPKNIESILSSRFDDWGLGSRRGGLYPLLGEGIFTQDGRAWKHSRELLRRQFARIQYQNLQVFDAHVRDLLDGLSSASSSSPGSPIDLQPFFFRFTLATTTTLIFGEPVGADADAGSGPGENVQTAFAPCFDYASLVCALRLRLADFHWLYNPKRFRRACAVVKQYASHFVARALDGSDGAAAAEGRHVFIQDLYDELKDPALVRDQLVNVLIAGRDTTACLMSWTFYLLVRHPNVLARLRKEIAAVVPEGEDVRRAHIAKIPYLRYVLNEILRLYPQLPVNVRVAVRTTLLPSGGGPTGTAPVLIRKGVGVGYSVYHMHRMTSLYGPDAEEFRPERWENTNLEKEVGWGFMPFHGGPRICLGKDFAITEASYGIVSIIQTFPNLRLPSGTKTEKTGQERQNLTIVVSSAEGCEVLLV